MADTASAIRRRLFIHPAHRTVGVCGGGIECPPYYRLDDLAFMDPDAPGEPFAPDHPDDGEEDERPPR